MPDTRRTTSANQHGARDLQRPSQLSTNSPVCEGSSSSPTALDLPRAADLQGCLVLLAPGPRDPSADMTPALMFLVAVLLLATVLLARAARRRGKRNVELAYALQDAKGTISSSEASLKQAQRKVRGLEAALTDVNQKLATLQAEILSLRKAPSEQARCEDGAKPGVPLPPDGQEVFLPLLDLQRVYQVTIAGTCTLLKKVGIFSPRIETTGAEADALYRSDQHGGLTKEHEWLEVDGRESLAWLVDCPNEPRVIAELFEEDRETHRYTFHVDGAGRKLGISLRPYREEALCGEPSRLSISLEVLPEGTALVRERRRRRKEAETEKDRPSLHSAVDAEVRDEVCRIIRNVRTAAGLTGECERLRKEMPEQADYIEREIRKAIENIKERS